MGSKILVIGIDAATWSVIDKNLDRLKTFKMLKDSDDFNRKTLTLDQKPYSAPCWASMFTGKTEEEHGHHEFVINNEIQTRKDIKADFIWDILDREGKKVKALNVPFIVPPYNFNIEFKAPGMGVPTTRDEWDAEIEKVTKKSIETLEKKELDLFITCYVSLDKIQHMHWGGSIVDEYYEKIDEAIGKLLRFGEKIIIASDHGFCAFGDAKVQTLPKVTSNGSKLRGDHHEDAILITKGIKKEINNLRDVFKAVKEEV
ncbi:MAG: alkaline phosphatase family protein [DPANN group archaeon]|nr:alkaline phosphatase family protein [DPANN group archaeon]